MQAALPVQLGYQAHLVDGRAGSLDLASLRLRLLVDHRHQLGNALAASR